MSDVWALTVTSDSFSSNGEHSLYMNIAIHDFNIEDSWLGVMPYTMVRRRGDRQQPANFGLKHTKATLADFDARPDYLLDGVKQIKGLPEVLKSVSGSWSSSLRTVFAEVI